MTSPFLDTTDLVPKQLAPGIEAGLASGEKIMLARVSIAPDAIVPLHSHPHEQAGVCLEGEFDLEVDGEVRRIRAGSMYLIPGDTPHTARGVGVPCVTLDIFSPPREDYLSAED